MKVVYLTWGETPRSYGVFGSQVISQLVHTKESILNTEFLFLSGVPIIHSGLLREGLDYLAELNKVKTNLKEIKFHWLPIWISQNFVFPSRRTFKWLFFGTKSKLKRIITEFNPQVVHCRSASAAWAALQLRKTSSLHFRIIFDARGLMPEETAFRRKYPISGNDYLYLKEIEKILLNECDLTVAVSDTMGDYYKALGAREVAVVYLSTNYEKLKLGHSKIKASSTPLKFCYVGALSETTWHKPSELSNLFTCLKKVFPDSKLLIVSTSNQKLIRNYFNHLDLRDITILRSYSLDELAQYIQDSDFGLLSAFRPSGVIELKLLDSVLGTKVAEYLCAGLPVILNMYCGGAAQLVQNNDLGLVYDPHNLNSIDFNKIRLLASDSKVRSRISDRARELFDYSVHARQYADIYRRLAQEVITE
jgi:glycosyltransferase involved in cell wall biosynthesis